MGNCAGYCTGEGEDKNEHHIKSSFNYKDLQANNDNDFESKYGIIISILLVFLRCCTVERIGEISAGWRWSKGS
jgi:hypothetical protein